MLLNSSLALAALITSSMAYALPATKVRRQSNSADGPIGYAAQNGGTTGGAGGTTTTVSSLAAFTEAVTADGPSVIYVSGTIKGDTQTKVASDKSILGLDSSSGLEGVSLYIKDISNVIVRNLAISKVLADNGDAIGVQKSNNVWLDHLDLSSDLDHDKDYYDGLLDVTHASEWVTISNVFFHDHWKASLIGHSDNNADEDTGTLHITFANCYWYNINSRGPSIRFGQVHIFNSYYDTLETGAINSRMGAKVLVESTVFVGVEDAILSKDSDETGTVEVNDVDLGEGTNTAPEGAFGEVPYQYTLLGSDAVEEAVVGSAGNTLTLG